MTHVLIDKDVRTGGAGLTVFTIRWYRNERARAAAAGSFRGRYGLEVEELERDGSTHNYGILAQHPAYPRLVEAVRALAH